MGFVGLLCDLPFSGPSLEVELPSCGKPSLLNVFYFCQICLQDDDDVAHNVEILVAGLVGSVN